MQMANSMATPDRADGMGHLRAYRAAVDGKPHGSKASRTIGIFAVIRRLIFAVVALFVASVSPSYAQSGPFAGMAGKWCGGGTVPPPGGSRGPNRCPPPSALGGRGGGAQPSAPPPQVR